MNVSFPHKLSQEEAHSEAPLTSETSKISYLLSYWRLHRRTRELNRVFRREISKRIDRRKINFVHEAVQYRGKQMQLGGGAQHALTGVQTENIAKLR